MFSGYGEACKCSSSSTEKHNNENVLKKAYYREVPCFSDEVLKRIPIIDLRRNKEDNTEMQYTSTYKRDYKPPCILRKKNSTSGCSCFTKTYYERVTM
jgi:hypothetical protein